jgi:hypothetical protein
MRIEEMRNLLKAQPFQPFVIHLPEGRTVPIARRDFALLSPNGRTLLAYEPDSSFNMIDVMLISSVQVGPPAASANGPANPPREATNS